VIDANKDPNAADLLGFRVNRRLKGIGHDMGMSICVISRKTANAIQDDDHVHAIVENAVHGCNESRTPAHVLMDNRQVLSWYADAHNHVTNIGQDLCKLHRLIQLQRRMSKTVDQVIKSLENRKESVEYFN
jgi:hypothetical protein